MYCTTAEIRTANKVHRCMNCAESIDPNTRYARWMSTDGGSAYTNKMHLECLESLKNDNGTGFWEYTLYGGERPSKKGADIDE